MLCIFTFVSFHCFKQVSDYVNGKQHGTAWKFKVGGGILMAHQSNFTGADVAYVYPDKSTTILGNFENGTLMRGQLCEISNVKFEDKHSLKPMLSFTKVLTDINQKNITNTYTYEPSNQTYVGEHPLQRDPMEEKYLEVGRSTIKGAGRGIFLKQDVSKGATVGFYNGVRLTGMESKIKYEDRKSPYRLDNDWAIADQIVNIPLQYRYVTKTS